MGGVRENQANVKGVERSGGKTKSEGRAAEERRARTKEGRGEERERKRERSSDRGERKVMCVGWLRRGGFPTAQCRYPLSTSSLAL